MSISSWQAQLRNSINNYQDLITECGLEKQSIPVPSQATSNFHTRVPRAYLSRIDKNNLSDPLLRQVLPMADEENEVPGFSHDAVGETNKHIKPGLIRKYHGRALLVTTAACAIHCRYCFRRHYPYTDNKAGNDNWGEALTALQADPAITEIILSGGDPLSLSDEKLGRLIHQLEAIQHLKFLRIHTRFPVVVPARITVDLLHNLKHNRFKTSMVLHINHPNEIDDEVITGLEALNQSGIQLFNQSVLLKGINDQAGILTDLSLALYQAHVLPYYLHIMDRVAGAAHFEVDEPTAQKIMTQLRTRLPGYLVPRLVKEVPDVPYKVPLA